MLHEYFHLYELSFRKKRFVEAELDFLQLNHMRLIDCMSNAEIHTILKRIGRFQNYGKTVTV